MDEPRTRTPAFGTVNPNRGFMEAPAATRGHARPGVGGFCESWGQACLQARPRCSRCQQALAAHCRAPLAGMRASQTGCEFRVRQRCTSCPFEAMTLCAGSSASSALLATQLLRHRFLRSGRAISAWHKNQRSTVPRSPHGARQDDRSPSPTSQLRQAAPEAAVAGGFFDLVTFERPTPPAAGVGSCCWS